MESALAVQLGELDHFLKLLSHAFARICLKTLACIVHLCLHEVITCRDPRGSRSALFDNMDGLEEGRLRSSSSYSGGIDDHDNEKTMDSLHDRVSFLKRVRDSSLSNKFFSFAFSLHKKFGLFIYICWHNFFLLSNCATIWWWCYTIYYAYKWRAPTYPKTMVKG